MKHANAGFTLVELMVGLLISLIGTLAMMSAFALFEGQKRTTTSGSDAHQAGSYSLFELERQVRTAGSGFVQGKGHGAWGCAISAYSGGAQRLPSTGLPGPFATSGLPMTIRAIPVLIASGGANPDAIAVVGGNPAVRTFRAQATVPNSSTLVLKNSLGIYANDYLLGVAEQSWPYAPTPCVMVRAASLDSATNTITLSPSDGPSSGLVGAFAGPASVFDLGAEPAFTLFGVDTASSALVMYDLLQRDGAVAAAPVVPIADGIVQLKALYGVDDGASGGTIDDDVIDEWVAPSGAIWGVAALTDGSASASISIARIKAVRIALVSRSQLPERAADYVNPYAVTPLTLFTDQAVALQSVVPTQSQYRYKVYDTTVPIRNWSIATYY